jgi:hypothetical protein
MNKTDQPKFEIFAQEFVRKYWETIKSNSFPMPPDEPIEQTLEEILSEISHQTELRLTSDLGGVSYVLSMMRGQSDFWVFTFRNTNRHWELIGASARSHDLLGPAYERHFGPFLHHVTKAANEAKKG